jgi:hypothetical protein
MKKTHDFSAQANLALAKLSAAAEAKKSSIAYDHTFQPFGAGSLGPGQVKRSMPQPKNH